MTTSAIRIDNLEKTYTPTLGKRSRKALHGVSLDIPQGEAFGFVGPNGAGKTTTIKILTGLLFASAGSASFFGVDVANPESRRGLGYVPENPYLYDYLTPYEILVMSLRLHGVQTSDERAHCMKWLERLSIANVAGKTIRSFSKGMTQRVALAQALCIRPRLLILDEPLSGLDPVGRRDVVDILGEYRRDGGTLFFSSHVLHDVERIADRFGLISGGRIVTIRSPQDLVSERGEGFVVTYQGAEALPGSRAVSSVQYEFDVTHAGLVESLQAVNRVNGMLLGVRPAVSLETVFFDLIGKDREGRAPDPNERN